MQNASRLYFIALLPPLEFQKEVTQIKQEFAENYRSRAALQSPPHVTLQPPFERSIEEGSLLNTCLREFAKTHTPIPMRLSGFGAFPPRVIYIDVVKTPELMALRSGLAAYLETNLALVIDRNRARPFVPHMTVAFRDLTAEAFKTAWPQFRDRSLYFEFTASHLTLLRHNGQHWTIETEFPLANPKVTA
jgi:2'-5' RNA ligase